MTMGKGEKEDMVTAQVRDGRGSWMGGSDVLRPKQGRARAGEDGKGCLPGDVGDAFCFVSFPKFPLRFASG